MDKHAVADGKWYKMVSRLILLLFVLLPVPLNADVWVDEDGASAIKIEDDFLSIYSLDDFYYFDELFSNVRRGAKLRLCVGFDAGPGMASDCVGSFAATPGFYNQGKNRALHFDVSTLSFVFASFEDYLRSGRTMKVSIDNDDLFSAYTLNIDHRFTEEALRVLALSD